MTNYSFGEILLLKFPHSEGKKESRRPTVVLAQTDLQDIIVAKVTSVKKKGTYDIIIDKVATLSKFRVINKLGIISSPHKSKIKSKIKPLFKIT